MLKNLIKITQRSFCLNNRLNRIYDTTFQIKDISMIKGTTTQTPYFFIDNQKVQLPVQKLIFDINLNRKQGDPILQFFDKDMNLYHPTTPMAIVCQEPFFIKKLGQVYCIMNNLPLVKLNEFEQFNGIQCSHVVESVCKDSLHDLALNLKEVVTGPAVHNMIVTNLLRHGMSFKIQKIRYKQLLRVTNRLISNFQQQITEIEYLNRRKANKRLRNYTGFLVTQYLIMHYYIYNHLSWDIMEPITVIFANLDLFIGYLFFVLRGRQWSLGEMHGSYIDQRKYSSLKKFGVNVQKYDQLLKIRQYLQLRLGLLSKNPYDLMQALSKPIKMLDTR